MATQKVGIALLAAVSLVAISLGAYVYMEQRAAEPVSDAEAQFIAEQSQLTTELMHESLDLQLEGLQESSRARLDSPTGQALMTRCLEWQQFHADHPTETTETNREKACSEYKTFIATGELPATDE